MRICSRCFLVIEQRAYLSFASSLSVLIFDISSINKLSASEECLDKLVKIRARYFWAIIRKTVIQSSVIKPICYQFSTGLQPSQLLACFNIQLLESLLLCVSYPLVVWSPWCCGKLLKYSKFISRMSLSLKIGIFLVIHLFWGFLM